ncbi:SDR family oxidoreductase [Alkalicoccobacillus murimartini]|uniref:NAD(P)-dependent dehydrogenase (Short-subunit alcohol dehydrogenase family) n=1 Tax=Alkalicoccobacillus murimartini TaxID=171685 RepID=A0ABT9YKT7_9BACI|nr:SDR family oxidoreductase [Alkalicoccobacillus murimartini]MDQ0207822.1 NAD(P)-dependent dehydrogenase (short-subunit alcohol dehydrogenase family) [Alkalicoccobacillus murimartini]
MSQKVAIVTGANSGMGLATSVDIANTGVHVIMLCRNEQRGKEAVEKAEKQLTNGSVELQLCDLASLEDIRSYAEGFNHSQQQLDIIVANAGVVATKRQETKDGYESMLGVNHLGHFLLINLLLERLIHSSDGRIVIVSSGAHKWGKLDFNNLQLTSGYNVMKGYGQSKLANVLFARKLAKQLKGTNVSVNSLHPGAVATNLGVDRDTGFGKAIHRVLKPFFLTPEQGSRTAVYLATNPNLKGKSGEYYIKEKPAAISKRAADDALAEKLWNWSREETGIK